MKITDTSGNTLEKRKYFVMQEEQKTSGSCREFRNCQSFELSKNLDQNAIAAASIPSSIEKATDIKIICESRNVEERNEKGQSAEKSYRLSVHRRSDCKFRICKISKWKISDAVLKDHAII